MEYALYAEDKKTGILLDRSGYFIYPISDNHSDYLNSKTGTIAGHEYR